MQPLLLRGSGDGPGRHPDAGLGFFKLCMAAAAAVSILFFAKGEPQPCLCPSDLTPANLTHAHLGSESPPLEHGYQNRTQLTRGACRAAVLRDLPPVLVVPHI